MLYATIISTEPSSAGLGHGHGNTGKQTIALLTPERADKWHQAAIPAISALRSGTRACIVVVGESPDRGVLLQRDERLKQFKIKLVQRELVVEVCHLMTM